MAETAAGKNPPLHFVSKDAAIKYFSHWEDADDIVDHKLSIGELS